MKKRVLVGALAVFKKRGIKFTMDDLAKELGMSKKTIYTVFPDKGTLLYELVDYVFAAIKETEAMVLANQDAPLKERIRQLLSAMPESYMELDLTQLYVYKDKYPKAYDRINEHLENGWETTHELLKQGVEQGFVKDINYNVFQLIYQASLERFLITDELQKYHISYVDAFHETVNILLDGILEG